MPLDEAEATAKDPWFGAKAEDEGTAGEPESELSAAPAPYDGPIRICSEDGCQRYETEGSGLCKRHKKFADAERAKTEGKTGGVAGSAGEGSLAAQQDDGAGSEDSMQGMVAAGTTLRPSTPSRCFRGTTFTYTALCRA